MRIGALVHAKARDRMPRSAVILQLGEIWRAQGHEFELIYGPDRERAAACDVLFNHVDLTRVPVEYHLGAGRVINAGESSVAKTDISGLRVLRTDDWDGPVMVKTDRNHGGLPESTVTPTDRWTRMRRRFVRRGWINVGFADTLNPHTYPVYESLRHVPRRVWRNPDLLVERFVPERDGDHYVLTCGYFLGDQVACFRYRSRLANVRTISSDSREFVDPPADFDRLRERSGLRYGKVDFVRHDGRSILLDVSRTPGYSRPTEEIRVLAERLAPGLDSLLAEPR